MALLHLLLHLLLLTTAVTARNTTYCSEVERQALLAIKTGLSHAAAIRLSSWKGFACCSWTGVSCTAGQVVKLDLRNPYNSFFSDPVSLLSPSLLHLTHLQYLDLSGNYFGSPIPTFIGSLTHLSYLNLSLAGFYGPIPQHLGNLTRLSSLDLSQNSLTADSLTWLSALRSIQYLDMGWADLSNATNWLNIVTTLPSLSVLRLFLCQLSGNLDTLGHFNLTSLTVLDLSYNGFYGPIPQHLGNLTRLSSLDLSGNYDLIGTRSLTADSLTWLSALRSIQYLDMGWADLSNATNWLNILTTLPSLSVLRLYDCQLSGNLVTLGHFNLTSLSVLDLSFNYLGNYLGGTIPTTIGNLTSLTVLDLSGNHLGGTIPATIGNLTNLQSLALYANNFTGIIPDTLGNLCNLTYLRASVNNLASGMSEFMEVLSQCKPAKLQYLDMSYNMFTGYLTEYVGGIQSLQFLSLSNNMFNGSIPISIGRISALSDIILDSNSFTGEVTEAHLSNLVNLKKLNLGYNSLIMNVSESWLPPFKAENIILSFCKLGPKFPTWLRNQTSLYNLDLSGASISSMIPSWSVELLPALEFLNLSSNQLNGEFPRIMLFSLSYLDLSHNKFEGLLPKLNTPFFIDISYNNFSGPISKFLSGMEQLPNFLILSHNRLNGSISPSICATNSLVVADLSYNEISGELPDCWGNSSSTLEIVDFSTNRLSGKIPSSMGNLNQLKSLHLSDNRLTGEIPLSLQNSTELDTLDLGNNNLQGNIPSWIGSCLRLLKVLRLRSNVLHGNIPIQLSLLNSLQVLDLGNNSLSGVLPPWLGNLTALKNIRHNMSVLYSFRDVDPFYQQYYQENLFIYTKGGDFEYTNTLSLVVSIDMSSNRLTGEIPDELTKLHGLVFLNLSNNHLRGGIPIGIGQLEKLESLDMSMNELSGSIPYSITSLYFLETLVLFNNNLSGPIPLGGQMSTFSESSFSNNVNLCGPPLPKKCSNDKPSDEGVEEDEDNDGDGDGDDDSETIWNLIIGFAPGLVVGFWTFIGVTMIKSSTRYAYFKFIDRIINLCM